MSGKILGDQPRVRVNITIDRDVLKFATQEAKRLRISRSEFLARCAMAEIERSEKKG